MINYILESSVCMACFYGFYWVFLRGEKLLSINRFYLLSAVVLSMLIPLLNVPISANLIAPLERVSGLPTSTISDSQALSTSIVFYASIVYVAGLTISISMLIVKFVLAIRRIDNKWSYKNGHIDIVETEDLEAYSFLNTIFIGKKLSQNLYLKEHIMTHEQAHIEGRHWLDTIFMEVVKSIYWFSPFSYFYSKSIRLQHEYIADHKALEKSNPELYEKSLLQFTLSKLDTNLVSNFNEHPIQKRLKMIQKLNSNVMKKLRLLLVIPIVSVLLLTFSCDEEAIPEEPSAAEAVLDAAKNTLTQQKVDKEIQLSAESWSNDFEGSIKNFDEFRKIVQEEIGKENTFEFKATEIPNDKSKSLGGIIKEVKSKLVQAEFTAEGVQKKK